MLLRLIRATGFKRFLGFVSPAFFDVVSPIGMLGRARGLYTSYRDHQGFTESVHRRQRALAAVGDDIQVVLAGPEAGRPPPPTPSSEADRKRLGEAVLRVYFHQLLTDAPTLLDLSGARFRAEEPVAWWAGPGHVVWSASFQAAIRRLYAGFYLDDETEMNGGLEALGLASAAALFRRHFGDGDQTAVMFSVEHFVSSFHEVFMHCKERGIRLHSDFLPLGIYLATLYEHLEGLKVPLDVRSAFQAANRTSSVSAQASSARPG